MLLRLRKRRSSVVILQSLLIVFSLGLAWFLRFEFTIPRPQTLLAAIPLLLLFRLASMGRFGLFHGYWTYAGLHEFEDILKSVALGTAGFFVAERYVLGINAFPLSIYILEALLTAVLLGGVRFTWRRIQQRHDAVRSQKRRKGDTAGRALIVGAGSAAHQLVFELRRHGYLPVVCVDDDPLKQGAKVQGVPVAGTISQIPNLVTKHRIDEILIGIASLSGSRMREVIDLCQSTRIKFRTIPSFGDLIDGKVTVSQLREVVLEDLLGREPVEIDFVSISKSLAGKKIIVTGAAGSIGSELCKQVLSFAPSELLCVDQDESGLFYLREKLQTLDTLHRVEYIVADIADGLRMREIMESGIDVVFHAAAYKHVPLMESNVTEAVRNNVFGLMTVLDEAELARCGAFVLISSDKAVCPSSVMGCTKRIGELILAARSKSRMRCVSVRFGNVLGSQGSVVPTFKEQICTMNRVTVTHPDITRFFMTIPEAVSLVLQAFTIGRTGEVMVLDMGEPIRIADLAKSMIRLLGKSEDDVEIVYTGLREGEKLFEELFYPSETPRRTSCDKVMSVRGDLLDWSILQEHLKELGGMVQGRNSGRIRSQLRNIVPEYLHGVNSDQGSETVIAHTFPKLRYDGSFALLDAPE